MLCLCGCQAPIPAPDALPERERAIDRLCEPRLKRLYAWCSCEALRRRLDYGEATRCSLVYETLLQRSFGGDFDAFLAWSRTQPEEDSPACPTNLLPDW